MNKVTYKQYVIPRRLKEVSCGERTYRYGVGEILRTPFPLVPSPPKEHDFKTCPVCQKNRTILIESLHDRYNKFPNCCESHKRLRKLNVFNKSDYHDAHIQCADSIIFCYDHILNYQNTNNWQVEIRHYIYRAVYRFGCMPDGYGSALFLDTFDNELRLYVKDCSDIRPEVKWYVNKILDEYITNYTRQERDPIEELLQIYNNWLNAFPFDLPDFSPMRKEFAMRSPLSLQLLQTNSTNSTYRLPTNRELVKWLDKQSKELFKKMHNSSGITRDVYKNYELCIKAKQLDIRESNLLNQYLDEEDEYLHTLNTWFEIQIERINLIREQLPQQDGLEETNSYKEAHRRVNNLKIWIEYQEGYKLLSPEKVISEDYLQILFKGINTIAGSSYRFDREVGNGRGYTDFIVSKGATDGTIVEFKLASNSDLSSNLQHQVPVYKKSCQINNSITVIFYFSKDERQRAINILEKQNRTGDKDIIMIDCSGGKPSASKVRKKEDV